MVTAPNTGLVKTMPQVQSSTRRARTSTRVMVLRTLRAVDTRGQLQMGNLTMACAIGRSGRKAVKNEGDGATPAGRFRIERVYYRADRGIRPRTGLPIRAIRPNDGWCDAVGDPNYNRRVRHPYRASAERLWRDDELYDIVVVLSHNRCPRVRGRGSAVFLHLARADFAATAGCVAVRRHALRRILARAGSQAAIVIPV